MVEFDFSSPKDGWIELEFKTSLRTHYVSFSDDYDSFKEIPVALSNTLHLGGGSFHFCVNELGKDPELERWELVYNKRSLVLTIVDDENRKVLSQNFDSFLDFTNPLIKALESLSCNLSDWKSSGPDLSVLRQFTDPKVYHGESA